jgi:hypothetical protein
MISHRKWVLPAYAMVSLGLLACGANAPVFNPDFVNEVTGNLFPLTPGPVPGYVMVMGYNSSDSSIEYVVTAETEEILVTLDPDDPGTVTDFTTEILDPATTCLFTDAQANTLGTVFNNTPVDWAPVPPGALTFDDVQDAVDQLAAEDPELITGRSFLRMLRVVRIGLGTDLNSPSGSNDGIIVRPAGSDPAMTAGTILPSNTNPLLSYNSEGFSANFGNGDLIIFLTTTSAASIGGVATSPGVVQGEAGNFQIQTFEILREAMGPISPAPP